MISIHTGKLQQTLEQCRQLNNTVSQLRNYGLLQKVYTSSLNEQSLIRLLAAKQTQLEKQLHDLAQYFQIGLIHYENAEQQILSNLGEKQKTSSTKEPFWNVSHSFMQYQHRFHTSLSENKGIVDYLKNGVCAGVYASVKLADYSINKHMKYMQLRGSLTVGELYGSGDAKATLFKDGKFQPNLELTASANASAFKASANLNLGNRYINAEGEITGVVGAARAQAKAIINKEEISLKAEVGAAALRGEVKASFKIFGIKISFTGSGELASVGAGAEFSSKKGELEFGGKFSLIAGLGFKIKVDYGG